MSDGIRFFPWLYRQHREEADLAEAVAIVEQLRAHIDQGTTPTYVPLRMNDENEDEVWQA